MAARTLTLILAVALLATLPAATDAKRKRQRLKAFSSCADLVDYGARFADRDNAPGGAPVTPVPAP